MNKAHWSGCLLLGLLAGCGGGGVGSTPAPVATPAPAPAPSPTPSPVALQSLRTPTSSKTFVNDSVTGTVRIDLTTVHAVSATTARSTLSIRYDAPAGTYSIVLPDRELTVGIAQELEKTAYVTNYLRRDSAASTTSDYLSMGTNLVGEGEPTGYVALALWQHNELSPGIQDSVFDVVAYGHATPAASVPRSGNVLYAVSALGILSTLNKSPKVAHGTGSLGFDLGRGVFRLDASLNSFDLLSGNDISGGGIELQAGGNLASNDGSFSGNLVYENLDGVVAGGIHGRLYGPAGEELGAVFTAGSAGGGALVGALTGKQQGDNHRFNLILDKPVTSQLSYGLAATFYFNRSDEGTLITTTSLTGSAITRDPDGGLYVGLNSQFPATRLGTADIVAGSNPDLTRYAGTGTYPGTDLVEHYTVDLAKTDRAINGLALSYLGFGIWEGHVDGAQPDRFDRGYFTYGLDTARYSLSRRTGSAHYEGFLLGAGTNATRNERYELSGTSRFDIDFSAQSYNGALNIQGDVNGGATQRDFGSFAFIGSFDSFGDLGSARLRRDGSDHGQIVSKFYGPDGEEIGSSFEIGFGGFDTPADPTSLAGISVAKRTEP